MYIKYLACCVSLLFAINVVAKPLPNAASYQSGASYRGVNLAGGAFASGSAKQGAFLPTLNDAALFLYRGMNTFRIPIAWEYLADKDGNFKKDKEGQTYLHKLSDTVNALTAKKAHVIIDIHNYMRYNPSDIMNNYQHHEMGDDVIGYGSNAPSQQAYANLWKNIVTQFHNAYVIYDLMNEPHDMPNDLMIANENAAIQTIRNTESQLNINQPHLIFIEGNNWTGLHSWTRSGNSQVYPQSINDPKNNFAIEIHQYFDTDNSGTYQKPHNDCITLEAFTAKFDQYWPKMTAWMKQNKVKVFLGEFGSPDTSNCRADITYLLDHLNNAVYSSTDGYGIIGWTVWAAGGSWGDYVNSIAPGSPANTLMFNNVLYQHYLRTQAPLPTRTQKLAILTNHSSKTLLFSSGDWPFWLEGSADLTPGKSIYLYMSTSDNKQQQYQLTYHLGNDLANVIGFGVDYNNNEDGYGFSYNSIDGLKLTVQTSCAIKSANGDKRRCWVIYP